MHTGRLSDEEVARLLPERDAPPPGIPEEILQAAISTFVSGRRLDMQGLAAELGISRSTLYRRVGDRDHLLGATVWYLTRLRIVGILHETAGQKGRARILDQLRLFMEWVHDQPSFRAFLDNEPEAALRILTSKEGSVQGALIGLTRRLLEEEHHRGNLELAVDPANLAYVIVRIAESFLYADVIARNDLDLGEAVTLIGQLLRDPADDVRGTTPDL
jgi:AcrR family transcriptional regulator